MEKKKDSLSLFLLRVLHVTWGTWLAHFICSSIKFVFIQLLLPGAQLWEHSDEQGPSFSKRSGIARDHLNYNCLL